MKVFISHAHEDAALAKRVAGALQEAGHEVWDEENQVLPGDNWAEKYGAALREAQAIVVLLTPSSIHSRSVLSDATYALGEKEFKDRFIPVVAAPPDELPSGEIPWIFKKLKPIELSSYQHEEDGLKRIAESLNSTEFNAL